MPQLRCCGRPGPFPWGNDLANLRHLKTKTKFSIKNLNSLLFPVVFL